MPTLIELQQALPLYAQLLFYAVIGALVVGTFFSIVGFMFRHALAIIAIATSNSIKVKPLTIFFCI